MKEKSLAEIRRLESKLATRSSEIQQLLRFHETWQKGRNNLRIFVVVLATYCLTCILTDFAYYVFECSQFSMISLQVSIIGTAVYSYFGKINIFHRNYRRLDSWLFNDSGMGQTVIEELKTVLDDNECIRSFLNTEEEVIKVISQGNKLIQVNETELAEKPEAIEIGKKKLEGQTEHVSGNGVKRQNSEVAAAAAGIKEHIRNKKQRRKQTHRTLSFSGSVTKLWPMQEESDCCTLNLKNKTAEVITQSYELKSHKNKFNLFVALGLSWAEINAIERDKNVEEDLKVTELFLKWANKHPQWSVTHLVEKLRQCEMTRIADKLEEVIASIAPVQQFQRVRSIDIEKHEDSKLLRTLCDGTDLLGDDKQLEFFLTLDLKYAHFVEIHMRKEWDQSRKLYEFVLKWISVKGHRATFQAIIDSLYACHLNGKAERLVEMFGTTYEYKEKTENGKTENTEEEFPTKKLHPNAHVDVLEQKTNFDNARTKANKKRRFRRVDSRNSIC